MINDIGRIKRNKRAKSEETFEHLLYFSFVVIFFVLVISQTILMSPTMHSYLETNNSVEGVPLGPEEYLYDRGKISLALSGREIDENLKVLINGEEAAAFSVNELDLEVKSGDVIEVDARNSELPVNIEVVTASSNMSSVYIGQIFKISSASQKILKVRLN